MSYYLEISDLNSQNTLEFKFETLDQCLDFVKLLDQSCTQFLMYNIMIEQDDDE